MRRVEQQAQAEFARDRVGVAHGPDTQMAMIGAQVMMASEFTVWNQAVGKVQLPNSRRRCSRPGR
jgi:hypothetical protein